MQGETVIDLGSGAGLDAFLAARKVGSNGRVIGVDMNEVGSKAAISEWSNRCLSLHRIC